MKDLFWHSLLSISLVLTPTVPSVAETLDEAWRIALATDQSLQAVRTQTTAAEADLDAAKANRLPVFNIDGTFTQMDVTPGLDLGQAALALPFTIPNAFTNDNFLAANASLSVPLYTSGLISSGIDAADAALGANKARESAFVEDVKLAVAESFVAVLRAQRAVDVTRTNVNSLEAHAKDVDNLFRTGVVPRNDVLAVEVSLANARQMALRAANGLDIAKAAYNRRLGRDMDTALVLDEVMPAVAPAAMLQDLTALTNKALSTRTELNALTKQASALRHQAKATRARTKPQLSGSAAYTYLENQIFDEDTFKTASLIVTWAAFDGGRTRHRANALSLQARSVSEQQDDVASQIRLQVRSAWLNINETQERLTSTEQATVQAEENLRVTKSRYQNGIGTNTEVLDAEILRTVSQSNHNNARYDAALARLRLARAIGVL